MPKLGRIEDSIHDIRDRHSKGRGKGRSGQFTQTEGIRSLNLNKNLYKDIEESDSYLNFVNARDSDIDPSLQFQHLNGLIKNNNKSERISQIEPCVIDLDSEFF